MAIRARQYLSSRLLSRARWLVFAMIVVVGIYLLAVTPVRTYLEQRHELAVAESRYQVLSSADKDLSDRATQLQSDAEIERLAREQYELVKPGEQAYAVMPPQGAPISPLPPKHRGRSLWSIVWNDITFWR